MEKRGLTVTEVADRMRQHLPRGESFATSNLSHYRQGRSVPRNGHLKALSLALGVDPTELTSADKGASIQIDGSVQITGPSDGAGAPATNQEPAEGVRSHAVAPRRPRSPVSASVIGIEDLGTEVRLTVDQRVPWEIGLKVLQILKGSAAE
jgi:transcriptional regulator with XRE-family HTH domain